MLLQLFGHDGLDHRFFLATGEDRVPSQQRVAKKCPELSHRRVLEPGALQFDPELAGHHGVVPRQVVGIGPR
jgi:hypothetical protein